MDITEALARSSEALVTTTTRRLYAAHPEWSERWGPDGRAACVRDIRTTLNFTTAALRSGDAEILTDYARWLSELLEARNVPTESARESFEVLADEIAHAMPAETAREARAMLDAARDALTEPRVPRPLPARAPLAERFLDAILAGDAANVRAVLSEGITRGMDTAQLADTIVQPAMTEVGARWARNEVTVAQEHRATALAQAALARLATPHAAPQERTVVFACVEGNLHVLGLRLVADAFEAAGWNVEYLGADVPTRDLLSFIRAQRVDLLGLSVALPTHLDTAQRVISALRRNLGTDCPRIVVGGRPVRDHSRGAAFVAADDLFTDASTGLAAVRE